MWKLLAPISIVVLTLRVISTQKFENEVVLAVFDDQQMNTTGWATLTIDTKFGTFSDEQIANNSGYAEGYLTAKYIYCTWKNLMGDLCKNNVCDEIWNWVQKQHDWVDANEPLYEGDKYWHQVHLVHVQIAGLAAGYKASGAPSLPDYAFDLMQLTDEFDAIKGALGKRLHRPTGSGSCSALVKLTEDWKELFFSHVTWNEYASMLRIFKRYYLPYSLNMRSGAKIPGKNITFSSYPGVIFSVDDFYTINTGLAVMETTNGNNNKDLWHLVDGKAIMEFSRVMIANRLAENGQDWVEIFSRYNSGTYNNQWIVVDYNRFNNGNMQDGTLWILEQLPGYIERQDMTYFLRDKGYWASYNIPFFSEVFNRSGFPEMVAKYGPWFTHEGSPRAQMFKRDQHNVKDVDSLLKLMRYNDFMHDPLSRCECSPNNASGENAISARSDLNPASGTYPFAALSHRYHGGTDVKVVSNMLFQAGEVVAIAGPTWDQQPVYKWSTSGYGSIPCGHPDQFKFGPVTFRGGKMKDSKRAVKF